MQTTRRNIVTQVAGALAVSTLPAIAATEPDDVTFRLLDAHKKAEQRADVFPTEVNGKDDPVLLEQLSELLAEVDELARDISRNEPSTLAGVLAVLKYVSDPGYDGERWPPEDIDYWPSTLHASLARALERIAGRTA